MLDRSADVSSCPTPLASVAILSRNCSRYIGEAISSVLAQRYPYYELLICDNASTDETESVVSRYSDLRVAYSRSPVDLGYVGNVNRALSLARGDYVAFLCCDDRWTPGLLERVVPLLHSNPRSGFAFVGCTRIDDDGHVISRAAASSGDARTLSGHEFVPKLLGGHLDVQLSATIYRVQALRSIGGFDQSLQFSPDTGAWLRLSMEYDVLQVEGELAQYRIHDQSLTSHFLRTNTFVQELLKTYKTVLNSEVGLQGGYDRYLGLSRKSVARYIIAMIHRARSEGMSRSGVLAACWTALQVYPLIIVEPNAWLRLAAASVVPPEVIRSIQARNRRRATRVTP